MLTVPKIRAAIYAIRKYYFSSERYQLRQNPVGISGEYVHLVKHEDTIDPDTLDIHKVRTNIIKNFSSNNTKRLKITVEKFIYRFFDSNFNITKTKIFQRFERKDSRGVNVTNRAKGERPTKSEMNKRNTSHLHGEYTVVNDIYPNQSFMPQEHPYLYSIFRNVSYAAKEVEKFYANLFKQSERDFWRILKHNLSQ